MTASTPSRAPKSKKDPNTPDAAAPADAQALVLGDHHNFSLGDLKEVELDLIVDPPGVPDRIVRADYAADIINLARSIREVGLRQPVCVEIGEKDWGGDGKFVRTFGRRRIEACRLNAREHGGKKSIMAFIIPRLPADERRTVVAVENIQRKGLTAAEEHLAVIELMELKVLDAAAQIKVSFVGPYGGMGMAMTPELAAKLTSEAQANDKSKKYLASIVRELATEPSVRGRAAEIVAAMLAKPKSWVNERLYVGRLSDNARALVLDDKLPLTHARLICRVADPAVRDELAKRYAVGGSDAVGDYQAGALEDLEDEVSERLFKLSVVPWRLDVAFADKPACEGCPSNSATNPGLFEGGAAASSQIVGGIGRGHGDVKEGAPVCTDHRCFASKMACAKGGLSAGAKSIVDSGKKMGEVLAARPYLAEGPLAKKVKDRQASKRGKKPRSGMDGPGRSTYVDTYNSPRAVAERKFERDCSDWASKAIPAIEAKIDSIPGARSTFLVLRESNAWKPYSSYDDKRCAAFAKSPGAIAAVKLLLNPSWETILRMEKDRDPKADAEGKLLSRFHDGKSGMVALMAQVLGVECKPMPKLDDYLAPVIEKERKEVKKAIYGPDKKAKKPAKRSHK